MAYVKWKAWEDFVDGMEEAGGFDGRVVVPLAGEWHADGSGYFTQVREKRAAGNLNWNWNWNGRGWGSSETGCLDVQAT